MPISFNTGTVRGYAVHEMKTFAKSFTYELGHGAQFYNLWGSALFPHRKLCSVTVISTVINDKIISSKVLITRKTALTLFCIVVLRFIDCVPLLDVQLEGQRRGGT